MIMSFVRGPTGASGDSGVAGSGDRRRSCRYHVHSGDAILEWHVGSSSLELPARLIDLSLHGCMLELKKLPAKTDRQSVRVRFPAAASQEWVEGVVRSIRKPMFKCCRIRIAFPDSFPYQTFKKLVYGREDFCGSLPEDVPAHEQDHYWK
jgi:PilZ domain